MSEQVDDVAANQNLQIADIRSFHIAGHRIDVNGLPTRQLTSTGGFIHLDDPNGSMEVGQLYAQYVKLASTSKVPVLMWHGGSMTGVTWETTPDGRPGWQTLFLRAGYDVCLSDAVERGRSSFAPFPQVYSEAPIYPSRRDAWELFRIGTWHEDARLRTVFPHQRFPVEAFDALVRAMVPRWTTTYDLAQSAYDGLVQSLGPCAVICHSQGGNFAFASALHAPELVRAVIAIEPSGAPTITDGHAQALRHIPHLFVWGDHLDRHPIYGLIGQSVRRYHDTLAAAGASVTWLDLPALGIAGNSHMIMMDRNSDDIASRIVDWCGQHDLAV